MAEAGDSRRFAADFESLTGNAPVRWQLRLFGQLAEGRIPGTVNLPTGLGKTSVIPIWLIALALSSKQENGRLRLPRRLVYIVNRRTVVDQATESAKRLLGRIYESGRREGLNWARDEVIAAFRLDGEPPLSDEHAPAVAALREALASLSGDDMAPPLAVSTLRGEFADNQEWKANPARPAIIIGTIDMIGSKLLFSGYGDGRYGRAHHAGLIGQDALIIHDEAHLTPAFSSLLWKLEREQRQGADRLALQVMELSATSRITNGEDHARALSLRPNGSDAASEDHEFKLKPEDEQDQFVCDRVDAVKRLHLHRLAGKEKLEDKLAELAVKHQGSQARVLLYVRSPEEAQAVVSALRKRLGDSADERVALLTGTMRGYERDRMLQQPAVNSTARIVRGFLDATRPERATYLVSTSAGEVGIDLDADHMVCDATTLDSLIQRLGRVNRRGGEEREARVDVAWTEKDSKPGERVSPMAGAVAATFRILERWISRTNDAVGLLVSPRNLRTLVESLSDAERDAAFSPKGAMAPLTDILLDNWSLTSIDKMPGRPEAAAYLHGLTTDPPETYVAWRKELTELDKAQADAETLQDWFQACPIETRERLRDRTYRVRETLGKLLAAHRRPIDKGCTGIEDFPVVLLDERERAERLTLSKVISKPDANERDILHYRTIVLPIEAGGLDQHGLLTAEIDPGKGAKPIDEIDVAGADGRRSRGILRQNGRAFWLADFAKAQAAGDETTGNDEPDEENGMATHEFDSPRDAAADFAKKQCMVAERLVALRVPEEGMEDEESGKYLLLMVPPKQSSLDDPEMTKFDQPLEDHTREIVRHMTRIADALWPNPSDEERRLQEALIIAAEWHDRGKDRSVWQRFARNNDYFNPQQPKGPQAKSKKCLHGRALAGYRHEFGSLLEAMADDKICNHPERDLILHLIAAHHGWARPHFEHAPGRSAYDNEGPFVDQGRRERRPPTTAENERAAVDTLQRFVRLQQRYGRWGLAWLESLLRCADLSASKRAAESIEQTGSPGSRVSEQSRDHEGAVAAEPSVSATLSRIGGVA